LGLQKDKHQKKSNTKEDAKKENETTARKSEFDHEEMYIKRHYSNVTAALELFKNDELCSLPGLIIDHKLIVV